MTNPTADRDEAASAVHRAREPLSETFARAVRVQLARRGETQRQLAERLGVTTHWLTRRVGRSAVTPVTLEDAEIIAAQVGTSLAQLLERP